MPTPRKGETREEMKRRHAANGTGGWRAIKRTIDQRTGNESTVYVPERAPYEQLPGFMLRGRSTLVDGEGNIIQRWEKERVEDVERWELLQAAIEAMKDDIPRAPVIEPPGVTREGLVSYPVGDHHLGMLAWKHEVGASWDIDIAENMLGSATNYLVEYSPPTEHALIAVLGDFMHYDSMLAMTPNHGNILDADGRAAKMVRAGFRAVRRMIETVASKHRYVHVIMEFGNHDPYSTLWMLEGLRSKYEDNSRIIIDTSPSAFHFYRYGSNLIATHHGDKVKPEKLPGIMAADRAQDWGATSHRTWYIGHRHERQHWDFPGCSVEMMRVLPGSDAYTHMLGYRSLRNMVAITYHKTEGEVGRIRVTPEMLK